MAKEVLIVGAGFGGLEAARELARRPSVNVTVVDQRNHHLFQPLLYQVATAGLNPADIASPVRAQFTHARNVDVHLGRVTRVDLAGAIADISRTVLVRDFRHIDPTTAQVILLEAGPRILPAFAEPLSRHAEDDLRALGVEVRTSSAVTNIDALGVEVGGKERI